MDSVTEEETAFTLIVDQDEDGHYFSYCAELKGIYGQGATLEEALHEAERSLDLAIEYYLETQKPLPLRKLIRVKKVVKTAASSS
jgi:predicted RNase H-like HicB family nuclease